MSQQVIIDYFQIIYYISLSHFDEVLKHGGLRS